MLVIPRQCEKDVGIRHVLPKPLQIEPGLDGDLFDYGNLVDIQPVAMARLQQGEMHDLEAALAASGLRSLESEPPSHSFVRGRGPDGPSVILGVHLGEGEIAPTDVQLVSARSTYVVKEHGCPVHEWAEVVEEDLELDDV